MASSLGRHGMTSLPIGTPVTFIGGEWVTGVIAQLMLDVPLWWQSFVYGWSDAITSLFKLGICHLEGEL